MRLSKKTFLYSIFIASVLTAFIVIYFMLMLPSLYVDYVGKENLQSIINTQKHYMETKSYKDVIIKNPTGSMSVEVPLRGKEIYLAGKNFKVSVTVEDEELRQMLSRLQEAVLSQDSLEDMAIEDMDMPDIDVEKLREKFLPSVLSEGEYPLSIKLLNVEKSSGIKERALKTHVVSDSIVVFEGGIVDEGNEYTSYIAVGKTNDSVVFSLLPVMTPQMKEIKSIVANSLPMIIAVVFLLVLIASQAFSRRIVNPVIRLSAYAQEMRLEENQDIAPLIIRDKDEIGELGAALNELYERLRLKYQELEEKNLALSQENKRQEVFLRASSHQLKTPVTAALLLVDGMIQEMGKYKNTREYLPVLKQQLLSMRKIVEDILYLNHCADHLKYEWTDIDVLVGEVLKAYQIQAEEKGIHFHTQKSGKKLCTDGEILKKILDNLVSNAVCYTPCGQSVLVQIRDLELRVFNTGGHIEEELMPVVFDPFVSSDTLQKGRGLGLYVASYYARLLKLQIVLSNEEDGVLARLILHE